MPECFVARMDKFLPQRVGRFKVNQEMMFIEDPPEFLRCSSDPCPDFDPSVVHVSDPVVRSSSCQGDLSSALHYESWKTLSIFFFFF